MTHILCFDISQIDQADYEILYAQATPDRKARADRYLRPDDKVRCVVADALLRYAVWHALAITEFVIVCNSSGKPHIQNAEQFHYNLSHSGRWVVIAYGDSQVGIDVEEIRMDAGKENIARRYFTPVEQEYIFRAAESHRAERFFQIWTGKESYLKYLGIGLSRPLDSFSVLSDGRDLGVRLHSTFLDGCCLTLCTKDENDTIELLTAQQLICMKGRSRT